MNGRASGQDVHLMVPGHHHVERLDGQPSRAEVGLGPRSAVEQIAHLDDPEAGASPALGINHPEALEQSAQHLGARMNISDDDLNQAVTTVQLSTWPR
jgi:hypothetical protein